MLSRLTGRITHIGEGVVTLEPAPFAGAIAFDVLVPASLAADLARRTDADADGRAPAADAGPVTLHTLAYLESPNQGATFTPRLIGFATASDRSFFEALTKVKGMGNRKALRALAAPPAQVAAWIAAGDVKALTGLPEIGKRGAETLITELKGKLDPFLTPDAGAPSPARSHHPAGGFARAADEPRAEADLPPAAADAVEALVTLGEDRGEARRRVARAWERLDEGDRASADRVLAAAYETPSIRTASTANGAAPA